MSPSSRSVQIIQSFGIRTSSNTSKLSQIKEDTKRDSIAIRTGDVNRPVWLLEMPKSTTRVLSATCMQTAVIIGVFIFFLLCLYRKLPQEDSEYPDGFNVQCVASSYKILDNRNVTIKCKACPECHPGQEPTPPCGSTIFIDSPIKCTKCVSPKHFSEEHSSGASKPGQSCGLRDAISPCTAEKNTQCGDCPRGHCQADLTMESCKKCSSYCGKRSFAELQCIYLMQCNRKNYIQQIENKQNHALTLQNNIQTFTTLARRISDIKMEHIFQCNLNDVRNITFRTLVKSMNPTLLKRIKLVFCSLFVASTYVSEARSTFQAEDSNLTTRAVALYTFSEQSSSGPVTLSRNDENVDTALEQKDMEPTMPLNSSYFGDLKKRMNILIAIASFGLLVLIFIAVIVICNFWKRMKSGQAQGSSYNITCCVKYTGGKEEYLPVLYHSTPQSDSEYHEGSPISDNMVGITSCETDVDTGGLEGLALTEIPLDLMDLLAIKLDGRRNGERLYGWQKVGRKFNIERDVLINLENEYITPAGSPTRQLLALLGCKGRTVAELVNALNSSDVDHADTASFVQNYFRDQRN